MEFISRLGLQRTMQLYIVANSICNCHYSYCIVFTSVFVLVNSKVLEDAWLGGREREQNCILAAYTHFLLSGTIGSAGEISLLQPKTDLEIPSSSSLPSMKLNGNTNEGTELSTIASTPCINTIHVVMHVICMPLD